MVQLAQRVPSRSNAPMADNRTISQLEAEGYPWIGCECCKGTVLVPFRMLRERIPMLSAMTLDQLGAKMRCDKCGRRPERYYPAKQDDMPGFVRTFLMSWSRRFDEPIQPPKGKKLVTLKDAAAYIMKLPKSKQQSPEWQAAGEAVIMAAEDRGPAGSRRDDTGVARRKADSGIRFFEREALGTAKAE